MTVTGIVTATMIMTRIMTMTRIVTATGIMTATGIKPACRHDGVRTRFNRGRDAVTPLDVLISTGLFQLMSRKRERQAELKPVDK